MRPLLAQKQCFVTADMCYAPPGNTTLVCATAQGSFVHRCASVRRRASCILTRLHV
jgi:hypothetical protein